MGSDLSNLEPAAVESTSVEPVPSGASLDEPGGRGEGVMAEPYLRVHELQWNTIPQRATSLFPFSHLVSSSPDRVVHPTYLLDLAGPGCP
jgi:hypothetical protein